MGHKSLKKGIWFDGLTPEYHLFSIISIPRMGIGTSLCWSPQLNSMYVYQMPSLLHLRGIPPKIMSFYVHVCCLGCLYMLYMYAMTSIREFSFQFRHYLYAQPGGSRQNYSELFGTNVKFGKCLDRPPRPK